jgi:hypothetical protein
MEPIKFTKSSDQRTVAVQTPYLPAFVTAARRVGAEWDSLQRAWIFDVRDEADARDLCIRHFGTDGSGPVELVTLRCEYPDGQSVRHGPIRVAGREVATASGRDSGARLGRGIKILCGNFRSGGSVKNWTTSADEGTVVLVRDVPKPLADRYLAAQAAGESADRVLSIEPEPARVLAVENEASSSECAKLVDRHAEAGIVGAD